MSTAGDHVEAVSPSSSSVRGRDRAWSKSRFIRSWSVMTSRNGSHRTIAIMFTSLLQPEGSSLRWSFLFALTAEVLELGVNHIALRRALRWLALGLAAA